MPGAGERQLRLLGQTLPFRLREDAGTGALVPGYRVVASSVEGVHGVVVSRSHLGLQTRNWFQPGHLRNLDVGIVLVPRIQVVVSGAHLLVLVGPRPRVLNDLVDTLVDL